MERTSKGDEMKEILSLKDSCLECISRNLSRYNAAFSTTEDADLRRNLEYLRRFHTSYLVEKIRKPLDQSYFNFLINEYLEELIISYFDGRDWDAVLRRTAEVGHAFQHVDIHFLSFLESEGKLNFVHEIVRNIPNVEKLELVWDCNDTTLEIIASSCPELKELTIYGGFCTNEGLKSLFRRDIKSGTEAKGPSLIKLFLPDTEEFNVGVEFLLRNMPSLENVDYAQLPAVLYHMHKDDTNIAQRKYNLLSLKINSNHSYNIADMLAVITEVCPRLRQLTLWDADIECLDLIARFSELEDLSIGGDQLRGVDCSSFLKRSGAGLRKLELHELQISADTLIQSCPKVEILRLSDITFRPLGHKSVLTPLRRLHELTLSRLRFGETSTQQSVTAVLKSSVNLRALRFHLCFDISGGIVTDLMKSCARSSLRHLVFFVCSIEETTLKTAFSTYLDSERTQLILNTFEV